MSKFKAGDRVECVDNDGSTLTVGCIYTIHSVCGEFVRLSQEATEDRGGWYSNLFELVEPKPSHPYKVGVKYFTRYKKGWRRFIGENLDTREPNNTLFFSSVYGDVSSRHINGRLYAELGTSESDILPEEYTEPPKEIDITRPQDYEFTDLGDEDEILSFFLDINAKEDNLLVTYRDHGGTVSSDWYDSNTIHIKLKEK